MDCEILEFKEDGIVLRLSSKLEDGTKLMSDFEIFDKYSLKEKQRVFDIFEARLIEQERNRINNKLGG